MEDQNQDTLLYVNKLQIELNLFKLFIKQIDIKGVEFDNLYGYIKIDKEGKTNLDFLLPGKRETKDSTKINLQLQKLVFHNSCIDLMQINTENPDLTTFTKIYDINSESRIKILTNDTINASISSLHAKTKDGFILDDVQIDLLGGRHRLHFPRFTISLPDSKVDLSDLIIHSENNKAKNWTENTFINLTINDTHITLSDFSAFVPELLYVQNPILINANISGRLSNMQFEKFQAKMGNFTFLDANLNINGLPNINEMFLYGEINKLQTTTGDIEKLISEINNKTFTLPKETHQLGKISYQGNIAGFLSDLVAYGVFSTNVGNLFSDISLRFENNLLDLAYNGKLKTNSFSLGKLLNNPSIGKIAMNINTKGEKRHNQVFRGDIKGKVNSLELNSYTYHNADFDGEYDGNGFNGKFNISDDNIEADFLGIIDFKNPKTPVFDFDLSINNTNFHALNLLKNYPDLTTSFQVKTSISGSNLDNLNGNLIIKDLLLTNLHKTLNVNDIIFTSRTDIDYTYFNIQSDYVNGSLSGNFKYSTITNTFNRILATYLPSLSKYNSQLTYSPNTIEIDFDVQNTEEISQILNFPYEIEGLTNITGKTCEQNNEINITAKTKAFKTEKQIFENISLNLSNYDEKINFTGRAQFLDKYEDMTNIILTTKAFQDELNTKLIWQNNHEITHAGELSTHTHLFNINDAIQAKTTLKPSTIIISDSDWHIYESSVDFLSDSLIVINDFRFENENQYIHINGIASKNNQDSLLVITNELDLDYIMQLVRLRGIQFGGIISGDIKLFSLLKQPILLADLDVIDFSMNGDLVADAKLNSTWNQLNNQLIITGDFHDKEKKEVAKANGVFHPKSDSLEINIDAKKFPTGFLNSYFEGVAHNFSGNAIGSLRIFGPIKHLLFDGELYVSQGTASVDILNTTYRFNDKVKLTPHRIHLDNILLNDAENNNASLNGYIDYNGMFQDMRYNVNINTDNILALNTTDKHNDFFYGKAYIDGRVDIYGDDKEANIVVNGTTKSQTKCYMALGNASSVMETDFIQYKKKSSHFNNNNYEQIETKREFVNQTPFNVKLDMQIEVTPEAEMELLVDPRAGDKITGRGQGDIRIKFDTFSDVELYGTVELEQASYLFTLQTVIRKEFKVQNGGSITWTGDPFDAKVDLTGVYALTASLADLIESEELRQITSRSTVPVHCLLHLTDDLMAPTIQFDIDLPSSDESVKSRVKNIINTEEMMNRQILYLMLLHKFFTPEGLQANNTGVRSEGISFVMASASAQLNSYLQSMLNTNVISLGFDWQKSDIESDEVKAQILIQPNNRLVINGNIGYRNDNISENKFIGDFDLEYKLLESGRLRFTAYNHTIDRAQLREAKTTQGIGLIYREDFNTVPEMFVYYWDLIKKVFNKKKNISKEEVEEG